MVGFGRGASPLIERRAVSRERGAVLVEAAIVTPFLVLLLFGIWTTARAWNIHNVLDHAAREAARYGAVDPTHSSISTIAQGEVVAASIPWTGNVIYCSAVIKGGVANRNDSTANTCITGGTGPGQDPTTDNRVQVTLRIANYPLNFVFFSTSVNLEARAVARLEP
jgi:Flp pilus assembly protein TadG